MAVAVVESMQRCGSGLFGLFLMVVGASIALDLVIELELPFLRSLIALLLLVAGSWLTANAIERRRPRANRRARVLL